MTTQESEAPRTHAPEMTREGFLALDEALKALARADSRKHAVIELRFFRGLSIDETASALGISEAAVVGELHLAQAWLRRTLGRFSS